MKRILISAVALLLFLNGIAAADRYVPTKGSFVRIEGTSTLHEWKMEGSTINGEIAAPPIEQWQNGSAPTDVTVTIPVASIKSDHDKMDKLMADALKADKNPVIRYELSRAILTQAAPAFTVTTKGQLTIAGVTREIDMQVSGTRDAAGTYVLNGQAPIRMSDFGIKPPTAMLGTIKTGNDVKVTFRWTVQPTKN